MSINRSTRFINTFLGCTSCFIGLFGLWFVDFLKNIQTHSLEQIFVVAENNLCVLTACFGVLQIILGFQILHREYSNGLTIKPAFHSAIVGLLFFGFGLSYTAFRIIIFRTYTITLFQLTPTYVDPNCVYARALKTATILTDESSHLMFISETLNRTIIVCAIGILFVLLALKWRCGNPKATTAKLER